MRTLCRDPGLRPLLADWQRDCRASAPGTSRRLGDPPGLREPCRIAGARAPLPAPERVVRALWPGLQLSVRRSAREPAFLRAPLVARSRRSVGSALPGDR